MFRHIGIVTSNVEESIRFYGRLGFSFQVTKKEDRAFIDIISNAHDLALTTTRLTNVYDDMIELLDYGDATHQRKPSLFDKGVAHFALTIESFESLRYADLVFLHTPAINPEGTAKVAFCMSPEGALIELVEMLT